MMGGRVLSVIPGEIVLIGIEEFTEYIFGGWRYESHLVELNGVVVVPLWSIPGDLGPRRLSPNGGERWLWK